MASDFDNYVWLHYDQIIGSLVAIVVTKWVKHSNNEGIMVFLIQWYY